jgi:hypothetical protein
MRERFQVGHPADIKGFTQVGHSALSGDGDGRQVIRKGDALYVGHFGPSRLGTSILDVSNPSEPGLSVSLGPPVGAYTHRVKIANGLLIVNHEALRWTGPFSPAPRCRSTPVLGQEDVDAMIGPTHSPSSADGSGSLPLCPCEELMFADEY